MVDLDFTGPVAKRIDPQTYRELKLALRNTGYTLPVESDIPLDSENNINNAKIVVQLLRINKDFIKTLKKTGFDISRILTPERLEFYSINN